MAKPKKKIALGLALPVVVLVVVAALGVGYLFWPAGTGRADPSDASQVAMGERIYTEHCASCHGRNLEGETPDWRTRKASGALPVPPHDATGHTWHHSDEQLFAITKYGVEPFAPEGYVSDMPAFEDTLTDAEIWAVLAYIKSRWPERIRRAQAERNARAGG